MLVKVTREGFVDRVRGVEILFFIALPDGKDLFPVCPPGAQKIPENLACLPQAARFLPGGCVFVYAAT